MFKSNKWIILNLSFKYQPSWKPNLEKKDKTICLALLLTFKKGTIPVIYIKPKIEYNIVKITDCLRTFLDFIFIHFENWNIMSDIRCVYPQKMRLYGSLQL